MTIVPIFKNKIINLPYEIINEQLASTSNDELKVLIAVFSNPTFEIDEIAEKLDITSNSVKRALNKWQDAGVLIIDKLDESISLNKTKNNAVSANTQKQNGAKTDNVRIHSSIPTYTTSELSSILQSKKEYADLINSCQQTLGKIFNYQEISIIIGLSEQFSLSNDFILLLCSYAVSIDKKSVRYIEKIAFDFYERDITTYAALEDELARIEYRNKYESFIRKMFGIGKRQFTTKEKNFIYSWKDTYHFTDEMIKLAYELTINNINEPNFNYTNSVLENWYSKDIKTEQDIEKETEARKAKNNDKTTLGNSYNTDDFFDKVLFESYKDKSKTEDQK